MSLETRDTEDWTFKAFGPKNGIQIVPRCNYITPKLPCPLELLALSPNGEFFAAGSSSEEGFLVLGKLAALHSALAEKSDKIADLKTLKRPGIARLLFLANGRQIVLFNMDNTIELYGVPDLNLISSSRVESLHSVSAFREKQGFVYSDGSGSIYIVEDNKSSTLKAESPAFCIKSSDDSIVYADELKLPSEAIDVLWMGEIQPGQLAALAKDPSKEEDSEIYFYYIQNGAGFDDWLRVDEPCPPYNYLAEPITWFSTTMFSFPKEDQHTTISASSVSTDLLLLTSEAKLRVMDDSDTLPFTTDDEDVKTVGACLDLSNSSEVVSPIKGIDAASYLPLWLILTQEGRLLAWHVVSKAAILNETRISFPKSAEVVDLTVIAGAERIQGPASELSRKSSAQDSITAISEERTATVNRAMNWFSTNDGDDRPNFSRISDSAFDSDLFEDASADSEAPPSQETTEVQVFTAPKGASGKAASGSGKNPSLSDEVQGSSSKPDKANESPFRLGTLLKNFQEFSGESKKAPAEKLKTDPSSPLGNSLSTKTAASPSAEKTKPTKFTNNQTEKPEINPSFASIQLQAKGIGKDNQKPRAANELGKQGPAIIEKQHQTKDSNHDSFIGGSFTASAELVDSYSDGSEDSFDKIAFSGNSERHVNPIPRKKDGVVTTSGAYKPDYSEGGRQRTALESNEPKESLQRIAPAKAVAQVNDEIRASEAEKACLHLEGELAAEERQAEARLKADDMERRDRESRHTSTEWIGDLEPQFAQFKDTLDANKLNGLSDFDSIYAQTNTLFQVIDQNLHLLEGDFRYQTTKGSEELEALSAHESEAHIADIPAIMAKFAPSFASSEDHKNALSSLSDAADKLENNVEQIKRECISAKAELETLDSEVSEEALYMRPLSLASAYWKSALQDKLHELVKSLKRAKQKALFLMLSNSESFHLGNFTVAIDTIDSRLLRLEKQIARLKATKLSPSLTSSLGKLSIAAHGQSFSTKSTSVGEKRTTNLSNMLLQERINAARIQLSALESRAPSDILETVDF